MINWLRRLGPTVFLGLCLFLILLSAYREATGPLGQTTTEGGSWEVYEVATLGQTFAAPFDGLYRVDLFLSAGGSADGEDLVLHLRRSPNAPDDLVAAAANVAPFSYGRWVRFEFAPIPDSGGKGYYVFLESPSFEPGDTLHLLRSREDRYSGGAYHVDGTPAEGDLAFSFCSRPGVIGWLRGLGRLLAQEKPSFWGRPACFGVIAVLCIILLLLVAHRLFLPEPEDEVHSPAGSPDPDL